MKVSKNNLKNIEKSRNLYLKKLKKHKKNNKIIIF